MSTTAIIAIIDVVFVLLLLLGFWVGSARGVKRSALELGITIVGVVIAGFITPPITNAVLGIQITMNGQSSALGDILYSALASSEQFGGLVESSPTLSGFLQKLPSVLLCAVFFLVINLIMRLFVYIIYKIIAVCAFKTRKLEKQQGKKRNWWLGGIIGAVKAFVLVLVIFMPLTSLIKLADKILPEQTVSAVSEDVKKDPLEEGLSSVPPIVKQITSSINKSAFGVLNGAVGLDDFIFDNISAFKVENGQKVEVRKEIDEYITLYHDAYALYTGADVAEINWNDVSGLYTRATRGGLFQNIILPTVGEVIVDKTSLIDAFPQLADYNKILDELQKALDGKNVSQYFTTDLDSLFAAVKALGEDGYFAEIVGDKVEPLNAAISLLFDHSSAFATAVDKVLSVNILHDVFSPAIETILSKGNEEILEHINLAFKEWEQLKTDIAGEGGILDIVKDINTDIESNYNGEEPLKIIDIAHDVKKLLLVKNNVPKILPNVGLLLDKIGGLGVFNNSTGNALDSILAKFEINNVKEVNGEQMESYQEVFKHLSAPVENLLSLDLYKNFAGDEINTNAIIKRFGDRLVEDYEANLQKEPDNPQPSSFLKDTLLPLYESTFIREKFLDSIISASASTNMIDLSLLDVYEERDATPEEQAQGIMGKVREYKYAASHANWEEEMPLLTQILTDLHRNKMTSNPEQSMLEYLLSAEEDNTEEGEDKESKMDVIIKELKPEVSKSLVENIMKARSTQPLKEQLSTTIASNLNSLIGGATVTFDYDKLTGEHAQAQEIAQIFADFIEILKNGGFDGGIKNMDLTLVGQLLEDMKTNAYRVELNNWQDDENKYRGIMREVFDKFIEYVETEFNVDIKKITNKTEIYDVNFTTIFELIKSVQKAAEVFEGFEDVVLNNNHDVGESVNKVLEKLDEMAQDGTLEENQQKLEDVLNFVEENNIEIDIQLDQSTKEQAESKLESLKDQLDPNLYEDLKNFLGLGGNA